MAGRQGGYEELLHPDGESLAIDRPVQNTWGDHPAGAKPGHHRGCFPVPERNAHAQPLAAPAAAMGARHVRRDPGFIDEDQPVGIKLGPSLEPRLAPDQDVRAVLLAGMADFFTRDGAAVEEPPDCRDRRMKTALCQGSTYLFKCDVATLVQQCEDEIGMRLYPVRGAVAASTAANA